MPLDGIVIEEHKSVYRVDTPDGIVECAPRGLVRNRTGKPVTGDHVTIEMLLNSPGQGLITSVAKRKNLLKRPVLANVDQVLFILTLREPPIDYEAIDRFLFLAETLNLSPVLLLNKIDLLDESDAGEREMLLRDYRKNAGYGFIEVSAKNGLGFDDFESMCTGKVSCLAGASGVGKSSILNHLFPDLNRPTQELSTHVSRGRQTTTSTFLLKLAHGGYIADTPGFLALELPYIYPEETHLYFPEIKACVGSCRFNNCLHENEPGCMVREKVEAKEIGQTRYTNYCKFLSGMRTHRNKYRSDK